VSWLVEAVRTHLGDQVLDVEAGFGPTTINVAATAWVLALSSLREAGAAFFDFLSAYDELAVGFAVVAHISTSDAAEHVLLRTRVPREDPALASAVGIYRGAAWHERETHEMFGIDFRGHPGLVPLLLPDGFSARPLRKDFVLASRVVKAWPGAKEPGESGVRAPARRTAAPPGVPADWARDPAAPDGAGPAVKDHGGDTS
jgi:NADH-quinone oxidoreductase subunit C